MNLESALAELTSKVGTELHVSPWITITQERIDRFADATGDHQWIHVDPERARAESPFGATIAHGYLVLSLYPSLRGHDGRNTAPFSGSFSAARMLGKMVWRHNSNRLPQKPGRH